METISFSFLFIVFFSATKKSILIDSPPRLDGLFDSTRFLATVSSSTRRPIMSFFLMLRELACYLYN